METDDPDIDPRSGEVPSKDGAGLATTIEPPASCWERYRFWYERRLHLLHTMVLESNPTIHTIEEQDAVTYAVQSAKSRFDELASDAYARWERWARLVSASPRSCMKSQPPCTSN